MYVQYQRTSSIRKLRKYKASELVLDEQNSETCSVLEATQPDELEKLFKDGDEHGVGSLMKRRAYGILIRIDRRVIFSMIRKATVSSG